MSARASFERRAAAIDSTLFKRTPVGFWVQDSPGRGEEKDRGMRRAESLGHLLFQNALLAADWPGL